MQCNLNTATNLPVFSWRAVQNRRLQHKATHKLNPWHAKPTKSSACKCMSHATIKPWRSDLERGKKKKVFGRNFVIQTNEKPAGRADAGVTAPTVKQLEKIPPGREWALTDHKYSHQELCRLKMSRAPERSRHLKERRTSDGVEHTVNTTQSWNKHARWFSLINKNNV